jgi:hypothetical protein
MDSLALTLAVRAIHRCSLGDHLDADRAICPPLLLQHSEFGQIQGDQDARVRDHLFGVSSGMLIFQGLFLLFLGLVFLPGFPKKKPLSFFLFSFS